MEFHDTTHTGELTSRMGSDIQELGLLLGNYFGAGIINLVQTVGSLGVALVSSPPVADDVHLADAHGVHSPTAVADHGDLLLQRRVKKLSRTIKDNLAQMTICLEEKIGNIRTVKWFNQVGVRRAFHPGTTRVSRL